MLPLLPKGGWVEVGKACKKVGKRERERRKEKGKGKGKGQCEVSQCKDIRKVTWQGTSKMCRCKIWKVLWTEERVGRRSDVAFVWAKLLSPDSELVKISVKFPVTAIVQVQSL